MPRTRPATSCPRPGGWCTTGRRRGTRDGVTVRNDTGVFEGGEISIHYDPMIAKLVTHAPDRLAAIEAQATALDAFVIDGIRHNIPFLSALMQHPRWREGRLSTGFIAEEFPDGFQPLVRQGRDASGASRSSRRMSTHVLQRAQAPDFRPVARARAAPASRPGGSSRMGLSRVELEIDATRTATCPSSSPTATRRRCSSELEAGRPPLAWRGRRRRDRGADAADPQRLRRSRMPASASTRASIRAARRSSPR